MRFKCKCKLKWAVSVTSVWGACTWAWLSNTHNLHVYLHLALTLAFSIALHVCLLCVFECVCVQILWQMTKFA